MDFDNAKENIQPLAAGRNISILQASLRQEAPQELMEQRRELEQAIRNYSGDDPLEPWYAYISWIEQSCPSGGKESGLFEVLTKCLTRFESERRYYQDRRMIKLYIKFMENNKDPLECYQQLFSAGIGTMVADFYIAWAYCYDLCGNYRKADEIFRHGIACRAEPFEELQEAHMHFGYSITERYLLGNDEAKANADRQLEERRLALTSLRGQQRRRAQVGSIRTGAAIKNYNPGTVKQADSAMPGTSQRSNARVPVFTDENVNANAPLPTPVAVVATTGTSQDLSPEDSSAAVVRSIVDKVRDQENLKEPTPWNEAHVKKDCKKFFPATARAHVPNFQIHVDEGLSLNKKPPPKDHLSKIVCKPLDPPITNYERKFEQPFIYPPNFQSRNRPLPYWSTPVTIEDRPDRHTLPEYNKCMCYPRPNQEFQLEEYSAYRWFRRRNEQNQFTAEREKYWSNSAEANVRLYPNFAKKSLPQAAESSDLLFDKPPLQDGIIVAMNELYNEQVGEEFSLEELLWKRRLAATNQTIIVPTDMDETVCFGEKVQRRKSFFPRATQFKVEEEEEEENKAATEKEKFEFLKPEEPMQPVKKQPTKETTPVSVVPLASCPTLSTIPAPLAEFAMPAPPAPIMMPPPALPTAIKPSKLNFEIFVEDSESPKSNPIKAPTNAPGVFDADETCSTQTFNIFLKSQSVSTPKASAKAAPHRQFGTLLKEVTPAVAEAEAVPSPVLPLATTQASPSGEVQPASLVDQENQEVASATAAADASYSPRLRKQLSTILETSEHGSTQGATTGSHASTKSAIYSPESEEDGLRGATARAPLETLQEATNESITATSTTGPKTEDITEKLRKTLTLNTTTEGSPPQQENLIPKTPAESRLLAASKSTANPEPPMNQMVGNFDRLEECEDTANGLGGMLRSVRFPEEKTETITKLGLTAKFNEDKTDTISKFFMAPAKTAKLEDEEQQGTDIALPPAPEFPKPLEKSMDNDDDSFDFFMKTPPKVAKNLSRFGVGGLAEQQTPLPGLNAKRFCDIETPKDMGGNVATKIPIFEDEEDVIMKHLPARKQQQQEVLKPKPFKNILRDDSFMPDFSLNEDVGCLKTQVGESCKPPLLSFPKESSFLPELSFVPDSQPAELSRMIQSKSMLKNISMVPDSQPQHSSFRGENQSKSGLKLNFMVTDSEPQNESRREGTKQSKSMMKNASLVPDSQPQHSSYRGENQSKSGLKLNFMVTDSGPQDSSRREGDYQSKSMLRNISMVPDSQPQHSSYRGENPSNSILKNISMVPDSQPQHSSYRGENSGKSVLKNISLVPDSQPQHSSFRGENSGKSILKNISMVPDSQPQHSSSYRGGENPSNSILKNISTVPDSQPQHSSYRGENPSKSILKNVSMVPNVAPENPSNSASNWKAMLDNSSSASSQPPKPSASQWLAGISQKHNNSGTSRPSVAAETMGLKWKETANTANPETNENNSHILGSFMKDFASIRQRSESGLNTTTSNNDDLPRNTSLKFLQQSRAEAAMEQKKNSFFNEASKSFGNPVEKPETNAQEPMQQKVSQTVEQFFELNAETAMFDRNLSMIKNSTLLHQQPGGTDKVPPNQQEDDCLLHEQSLHIKTEQLSFLAEKSSPKNDSVRMSIDISKEEIAQLKMLKQQKESSFKARNPNLSQTKSTQMHESNSKTNAEQYKTPAKQQLTTAMLPPPAPAQVSIKVSPKQDPNFPKPMAEDDCELSIYYKQSPRTPQFRQISWDDADDFEDGKNSSSEAYVHNEPDLDHTLQLIENMRIDPNVNPFSVDLINAFLDQIDFTAYLESLPTCQLLRRIPRLHPNQQMKVNEKVFQVQKLVGQGAYGAVYCGKDLNTGVQYALKQERPPNYWEYYICLQVRQRLRVEEMFPAYMSVEYALIGNNSSVLISQFSTYGSIITVANQVKKRTLKNIDEYVVMHLTCELLDMFDHLHAIGIIHADVKPDNILLMQKLEYPAKGCSFQLIDFGVAIDMNCFQPDQTFNYVHNDNAFRCVEMREKRPWTYQLDLYGLAGCIHVMLFGKYMEIEKNQLTGYWSHKTYVPRYFNKQLWETIFRTLLNVHDCRAMPNLQQLRVQIKEELAAKEKYVIKMINEFNSALTK